MTFWADHPKWSYCRMREDGTVSEVVEKQVVSNEATVGIYNFRQGRDFVRAAEAMIQANLRVNNEFYVAPLLQRTHCRRRENRHNEGGKGKRRHVRPWHMPDGAMHSLG